MLRPAPIFFVVGAPRFRVLVAVVGAALLLVACVSDRGSPHSELARTWRDFLALPEHRALAIAGDPERIWVSGATGGQESPEEAEEAALAECRRRRAQRRMQAACQLYAVGDEIVRTGPE